jgi:phospholipid/cholesterol/gamma-HCH transport system substrate-binding protein
MKRFDLEFTVGIFVIIGILSLAYLSVRLGGMEIFGTRGYDIRATFSNSGGLTSGASVVISGVSVGRVKEVSLEEYEAMVVMQIPREIAIQEDAIASIKTRGLIGEKYVEITPGASERNLPPNGVIRDTQPAVDLEQIISGFVFGKI